MNRIILIAVLLNFCSNSGCQNPKSNSTEDQDIVLTPVRSMINSKGHTLESRINVPDGFQRSKIEGGSYATYLRGLKLKPDGSEVRLYDGSTKPNNAIYQAVVDLDIGDKDLHQCADAVMRLHAEYLWQEKKYAAIHFKFTNGFRVNYTEWMKGRRMIVKGNKTYWNDRSNPSNTYEDFWNYLELVFMYAGTSSLSKELNPVEYENMKIGDVFIIGGFPGHAVLVVDMATNLETGKKIFLLAQSYMPAQEIQILMNPSNEHLSPWYELNNAENIITPEWNFSKSDLKRF